MNTSSIARLRPSPQRLFVLCLGIKLTSVSLLAAPDQAYHRQPVCADGNCVPNRATNGYHATRWRPWPGGEPSQSKPTPPVGIELPKTDVPLRDKELDLPTRTTPPAESGSTQPSPNDKPSGGLVLPPEFRDVTPKKPTEEPLPGNSGLQRSPRFPGSTTPTSQYEPLLIGKKPESFRSVPPALISPSGTAPEPMPTLKIRPAGNSQSGLMPEMVPWNDEDRNPIVLQAARISGSQVQQTISLEESPLPSLNDDKPLAIRIHRESSETLQKQTHFVESAADEIKPYGNRPTELIKQVIEWRAPTVNAPGMLPTVEAQPLMPALKMEPVAAGTPVVSPLRGLSQGNPLRR